MSVTETPMANGPSISPFSFAAFPDEVSSLRYEPFDVVINSDIVSDFLAPLSFEIPTGDGITTTPDTPEAISFEESSVGITEFT